MNNSFYTYIYLDPRQSGRFVYNKYQFDHEPFYIGKGKGDRWKSHLNTTTTRKDSNRHKINVIKQILSENLHPVIIKYKKNLTEQEAFDLECDLIEEIGRRLLKTGPLTNLTNGGEGGGNYSEETKLKMANKGAKNGMFGKHHTERAKRIIGEANKKEHSLESRQKRSKSMTGRKNTVEQNKKISENMKKMWADPTSNYNSEEYSKKLRAANKKKRTRNE